MSPIRPLLGEGRIREQGARADPFQTTSWMDGRLTLDHRRLACRDAELVWTAPHHLLVLTENGGTTETHVRIAGRRAYEGRDQPGALSFIPATADRHCTYRNVELIYSALWFDPVLCERLLGCNDIAASPPVVNGSDPVIAILLRSLRDEVAAGHHLDAAYIEHLAAVILLRIARLNGSLAAAEAPRQGRGTALGGAALARVQDYIEANIGSDIALSDLANLLDMPVDTFARRFRAATGLAPYAYVIERRVRRAETLLRTTDRGIATIAFALGFSSQSHLTSTFRRVTGTTPRVYRAQFFPET